jgi:hypothetical protein
VEIAAAGIAGHDAIELLIANKLVIAANPALKGRALFWKCAIPVVARAFIHYAADNSLPERF